MRVALYGKGQVNRNVARILASRDGYDVVGPLGRDERAQALESEADVVVIATTSFLSELAPDIEAAVAAGSNVITTAEECAFPWAVNASLADTLDEFARTQGVTILGAGLNPGFAFDALVLTTLGVAWDVERIRVERVVDLSGFSATILRRLGVGYRAEEFELGTRQGSIHGHIGFPQSMRIVARKLGVELARIERRIEPILATQAHAATHLSVTPGETAGFRQFYTGVVDEHVWFECVFLGHLDPDSIGEPPRDSIAIDGTTPLRFVIEPGLNPQTGSSAVIANSLRRVSAAPAGWLTVADLPAAVPT
jgi:4-hydroxy-tetrahydrodipicolinate reductase